MADVYQEQARFFANVPLMQSGVVASVHLADGDDKGFWDAMLQTQHPGRYYFITHSCLRRTIGKSRKLHLILQ